MAKGRNYSKDLKFLLYLSLTILIILLSILNLQKTSNKEDKVLGVKTEINVISLEKEKEFWENFLKVNTTYYDGWVELSKLNQTLGNNEAQLENLQKAKGIDFNH